VEPVSSYVICCVQRTGSWLLAHTLADTGYAGRPSDYFDEAERETRTREWGLPPVRYRKQADSLTERYVDLVRSAMTPGDAQRPAPGATG
jgi:LPS sulfotransferase NodH